MYFYLSSLTNKALPLTDSTNTREHPHRDGECHKPGLGWGQDAVGSSTPQKTARPTVLGYSCSACRPRCHGTEPPSPSSAACTHTSWNFIFSTHTHARLLRYLTEIGITPCSPRIDLFWCDCALDMHAASCVFCIIRVSIYPMQAYVKAWQSLRGKYIYIKKKKRKRCSHGIISSTKQSQKDYQIPNEMTLFLAIAQNYRTWCQHC